MSKRPWLLAGVVLAWSLALPLGWLMVKGGALPELEASNTLPSTISAGPGAAVPSHAALVQQGAYLARVGNCAACHTERGGEPFAGGRGIHTPWGTVFAGNLTPDPDTGLGQWTSAEF